MTNYAERLAGLLPAAEAALSSMPGDPGETVPGLTKAAIIEFLHSLQRLLALVDSGKGVDWLPLIYGGSNAPEQIIGTVSAFPPQAPNGYSYFIQNYLTTLVDLRARVEASVGAVKTGTYKPADLRRRLVTLESLLEQTAEHLSASEAVISETQETQRQAEESIERLDSVKTQVEQLVGEIEKVQARANYVLNDNSDPAFPSIESLYELAIKSRGNIDGEAAKVEAALKRANRAAGAAESERGNAEKIRKEAQGIIETARQAMRGATQVGLAESFVTERDAKLRGLAIYGTVLIVAVGGACAFAVWEVIPAVKDLTDALKSDSDKVTVLGISLLVRTVLLAPFVFLAWFAAIQYRRIDLLRIDYAAKAAAAKAYIGYKDEVKGDARLVTALRAFLIQRFGEHPVRLVTKEHDEEIPLSVFGVIEPRRRSGRSKADETDPTGE